jgi:protein-L-isoaspartate O-methyltransferase
MLQLLDIKKGGRYLDIGTGTGYVAALMATATGKGGK